MREDAVQRPRSLCDVKLLAVVGDRHSAGVTVRDPRRGSGGPCEPSPRLRESWPSVNHNFFTSTPPPQNLSEYRERERAVSMAGLVNTTVPQRLVSRPIRGQHTPTRHSLRHSRMISLIQQGKVPRKYLPPVIHHHRLGAVLVTLQTLLGTSLIAVALYFLLWSPHLRITDVPHWSGATLALSGLFGIFLICCCRKQYPGMRGGCCVFAVKVQYIVCSVFLAMAATAACLSACVFNGMHVSLLYQMNCTSHPQISNPSAGWNSTCLCQTGTKLYTYDPLSCPEVKETLPVFLLGCSVVNGTGVVLCIWYVLIVWNSRYSYSYAGIKSAEQKAAVMSSIIY